ncbi:MAG: TolC family protein [Ferruginibacter sp.]|jgi:cobalt-zinc-cadmium efflux system outer membrane protein|uniref:TolC family protein n=1 Tax=Ferruginibacter sp. TaxID=1940288 RepID=UPI002658C81A|nr:TolC family protein [Ferruginibacter sp.]MDB5280455.1 TolC family protein [Ferruginibacter sp.]
MQKISLFFIITVLCFFRVSAQTKVDTLSLSFPAAEKIFLQNNLSLLAARYNVDVNKALIKQAKLWDNPVLTTDQNIYDGKFFQHNATAGQVYVQVMQLVRTAGKRNKAAQLAADNTTISQEQFDDLLRTLRYTLHNDLLEVSHLLKIKKVYTGEIDEVNKLSKGMDLLLQAGNVSVKDNLRIKALLFSLQNELVNTDAQLINIESEVKLLLNNNEQKFISPLFDYKFGDLTTVGIPDTSALLQQAIANRPDARLAQTALALQNHNLTYQKALAKPDISIGTEYDQRSSYANNYVGLAVSLPLNIFNKNQGNIAAAKFSIQQQQAVTDLTTERIKNEISNAASKFAFYQSVNNRQQLNFSQQYDTLFTNMLQSYQQRQLSLLEFIDFMDAYKDTKLKLLEQHNGLVHAAADLNYTVGNDVIKLD